MLYIDVDEVCPHCNHHTRCFSFARPFHCQDVTHCSFFSFLSGPCLLELYLAFILKVSVFFTFYHVLVAFAYCPFIGYCFSVSYIATSKRWQWILCGRFFFFWRAELTNRSTLFAAAATTVRHTRSVVHLRWYVQLVRVVLFSRKRTATLANIKFNQIGRDTSCWHSVWWGSKFWAHPPSLLSRSWPRGEEEEEDSRKFSRPSYLGSWVGSAAAVHFNILFYLLLSVQG